MKKEHKYNSNKLELLSKQNDLLLKIGHQKDKLYNSLCKLQQKEERQKGSCFCKGICLINHSKYRWNSCMSDTIVNKLKTLMQPEERSDSCNSFKCPKCDVELQRKEFLQRHIQSDHESDPKYNCHGSKREVTTMDLFVKKKLF